MPAVPACAALSHSAALLGFGYSYGTEAEVSTIRALGLNLCRCIPASGFKLAVCKWKVVLPQRLELLLQASEQPIMTWKKIQALQEKALLPRGSHRRGT